MARRKPAVLSPNEAASIVDVNTMNQKLYYIYNGTAATTIEPKSKPTAGRQGRLRPAGTGNIGWIGDADPSPGEIGQSLAFSGSVGFLVGSRGGRVWRI